MGERSASRASSVEWVYRQQMRTKEKSRKLKVEARAERGQNGALRLFLRLLDSDYISPKVSTQLHPSTTTSASPVWDITVRLNFTPLPYIYSYISLSEQTNMYQLGAESLTWPLPCH